MLFLYIILDELNKKQKDDKKSLNQNYSIFFVLIYCFIVLLLQQQQQKNWLISSFLWIFRSTDHDHPGAPDHVHAAACRVTDAVDLTLEIAISNNTKYLKTRSNTSLVQSIELDAFRFYSSVNEKSKEKLFFLSKKGI